MRGAGGSLATSLLRLGLRGDVHALRAAPGPPRAEVLAPGPVLGLQELLAPREGEGSGGLQGAGWEMESRKGLTQAI